LKKKKKATKYQRKKYGFKIPWKKNTKGRNRKLQILEMREIINGEDWRCYYILYTIDNIKWIIVKISK
jgi:hypothetical protein